LSVGYLPDCTKPAIPLTEDKVYLADRQKIFKLSLDSFKASLPVALKLKYIVPD
jgi:hypothetical protein